MQYESTLEIVSRDSLSPLETPDQSSSSSGNVKSCSRLGSAHSDNANRRDGLQLVKASHGSDGLDRPRSMCSAAHRDANMLVEYPRRSVQGGIPPRAELFASLPMQIAIPAMVMETDALGSVRVVCGPIPVPPSLASYLGVDYNTRLYVPPAIDSALNAMMAPSGRARIPIRALNPIYRMDRSIQDARALEKLSRSPIPSA